MQPKLDRRIERTNQLLENALVALVLEKGYEAVTIKDITDRANVAYVTFFRRYKDKDELLVKMLEAVVEEISALANQMTPDYLTGSHVEEGVVIFRHAQANHRLYRLLLSSPGALPIVKRVRAAIAASILHYCDPGLESSVPLEVVAHHSAASLLALIEWWLEHDMPYPPERMGEIYETMIIRGTWMGVLTHDADV